MSTIYDVAELAGVSASTVSRVLSGTIPVSEKTKLKVEKAIEQLNYKPSILGQTLSTGTGRSILAAFPLSMQSFLAGYLGGIDRVLSAQKERYDLIMSIYDDDDIRDPEKLKKTHFWNYLERGLVGGCIFLSTGKMTSLPEMDFCQIPTVCINDYVEQVQPYTVSQDMSLPVYELTCRLIARGKRHFSFVHAFEADHKVLTDFSQIRFSGMLRALTDSGLTYDESCSIYCPMSHASGPDQTYTDAVRILDSFLKNSSENSPDAFICAYDSLALACLHTLQRNSISVPGSAAVVGFDNSPQTAYCEPQITSVRSPVQQFGEKAAEMIIDILKGSLTEERHILIKPEIFERGSTDSSLL